MPIFDTSFVIDMLRGGRKFSHGYISILTLLEVLRGVPSDKVLDVKRFMEESFEVVGLTNDVLTAYHELYITLKSSGELIPDIDLLIGATAKALDEELYTYDMDFEVLEKHGLKLHIEK
jgi:predicted nucleic acid-binding protein